MSRRTISDRNALNVIAALLQARPADALDRIAALVSGTGRVTVTYYAGDPCCTEMEPDGACRRHGHADGRQRHGGAR